MCTRAYSICFIKRVPLFICGNRRAKLFFRISTRIVSAFFLAQKLFLFGRTLCKGSHIILRLPIRNRRCFFFFLGNGCFFRRECSIRFIKRMSFFVLGNRRAKLLFRISTCIFGTFFLAQKLFLFGRRLCIGRLFILRLRSRFTLCRGRFLGRLSLCILILHARGYGFLFDRRLIFARLRSSFFIRFDCRAKLFILGRRRSHTRGCDHRFLIRMSLFILGNRCAKLLIRISARICGLQLSLGGLIRLSLPLLQYTVQLIPRLGCHIQALCKCERRQNRIQRPILLSVRIQPLCYAIVFLDILHACLHAFLRAFFIRITIHQTKQANLILNQIQLLCNSNFIAHLAR